MDTPLSPMATLLANLRAQTPPLKRWRFNRLGELYESLGVSGGDGDGDDDGTVDLDTLVARTAEVAEGAEAPDDHLSRLDDPDEVTALRGQLQEAYDTMRAGPNGDGTGLTRDEVSALTIVSTAIAACDARTVVIEEEQAAIDADLAQLDQQVQGTATGEGEGDQGDGDGAGEGDQPATGDGEGEGEGDGDGAADRVAAGAVSTLVRRPSLSTIARTARRRSQARQGAGAPRTDASTLYAPGRMLAGGGGTFGGRVAAGTAIDGDQLGRELKLQHAALQTLTDVRDLDPASIKARPGGRKGEVYGAGGRKVYVASQAIAQRPGVVHVTSATQGAEVIDQAVEEWVTFRDAQFAEMRRVTASGGDCEIVPMPDYSLTIVGKGGTSFTDKQPTIVSERPIGYFPWWYIDQTATEGRESNALQMEGFGQTTVAQDAAGYGDPAIEEGEPGAIPEGGRAYKEFVHIDCPDEMLRCDIEAIHQGLVFGHFQAMSHPEYVAAFKQYVDIYWDIKRDRIAIDKVVAEAALQGHLVVSGAADKVFGAVGSLKDFFNRVIAKERSARHDPTLSLNVWAPEWFGGFLARDLMLQANAGPQDLTRATPQQAMSLASTDGIRLDTYNVESWPVGSPGGARVSQVLPPVTGGELPQWPTKVRLIAYADGAVYKRTQGELRLGLRETLVRTNDFGTFLEVFENVCFRGNVYVFDLVLCPNGATGAPVAKVCA